MTSSKDRRTQWTPIDLPETTPTSRARWEPLEESFSSRRSEALDTGIFKSPELFRQAVHKQGHNITREILTRAIKAGEVYRARPVKKDGL